MNSKNIYVRSLISGILTTSFAVIAVVLVHIAGVDFKNPPALIAVTITAFLSGFFSRYFALKERIQR